MMDCDESICVIIFSISGYMECWQLYVSEYVVCLFFCYVQKKVADVIKNKAYK